MGESGLSLLTIRHTLYKSSAPCPPTENKIHNTRLTLPHTSHGRGDTVSVNSTAAQAAISNNSAFSLAGLQLLCLSQLPQIPLETEVAALLALGNATWGHIASQTTDSAPQWVMGSYLCRHLLQRPWIAYRMDVASVLLRRINKEEKPPPSEECYEATARALFAGRAPPLSPDPIVTARNSRCGLVFGALVQLRTVVALSYTRDCFLNRGKLADWLDTYWRLTNWAGAKVVPRAGDKPLLWMDAFGMDGKSQAERYDWAKYGPFIYVFLPVLAYVPPYTGETRARRVELNQNMCIFDQCDSDMASLVKHVARCRPCRNRIESIHEQTQQRWGETFGTGSFQDDIGLDTVCLLDHMHIWTIIERTLAMHKGRLLYSGRGWKLVYATYCLGVLAINAVTNPYASCGLSALAMTMIEKVQLAIFKGIVQQLGSEARLAVPTPSSPAESRTVPQGRAVQPLNYADSLSGGYISGLLGLVQPVLDGQVPSVRWRGKRDDLRFLALFASLEPNFYDHAIASAELSPELQVELIKRQVEGVPSSFFPEDYVRNWLDDQQTTNFDWKLSHPQWYISKMAPGMNFADGSCFRTGTVSPVLVYDLKEMVGGAGDSLRSDSRSVSCPIVPLLVENMGNAGRGIHDGRVLAGCEVSPNIEGISYGAFVIRSFSYEQRSPRHVEYVLDVAVGERTSARRNDDTPGISPLFVVSFVGREVEPRNGEGTSVKWNLVGDNNETGSSGYCGLVRRIPLIIKRGNLISLLFQSHTTTSFKSYPWDHSPVPLAAPGEWTPQWAGTDLRLLRQREEAPST